MYNTTRREFITRSILGIGGMVFSSKQKQFGLKETFVNQSQSMNNNLSIHDIQVEFEREPLIHPFGFKGGYTDNLRQVFVRLSGSDDKNFIGLSVQSPRWCDSSVSKKWSESGSNALMYCITEMAKLAITGNNYISPVHMIDEIFEEVHKYGKAITINPELRKTFTLNALASMDIAAWLLYSNQNDIDSFDNMIPGNAKDAFAYHHDKVLNLPFISYSSTSQEILALSRIGYSIFKVKIGSPGSQQEMVEKDIELITKINKFVGGLESSYTKNGKVGYILDANGRYEDKSTLSYFIDFCHKANISKQILFIEEPFRDVFEINVNDYDIPFAADESIESETAATELIKLGYKIFALKPIPKTLSKTFRFAKIAYDNNIHCYCADLTVNPLLVDWNKNIAARLKPIPGLTVGLLGSNGHQNYLNWDRMRSYHPRGHATWTEIINGVYELNKGFYDCSGGIYDKSTYYSNKFNRE